MRYSKIFVVALAALLVAGMAWGGCGQQAAPKPLPEQPGEPAAAQYPRLIIGYYENPWPGTPDKTGSFPSMKAYGQHMTAVAPFWYRAKADGTLDAKESELVLAAARQQGLKIYPLITNRSGATDQLLGNAAVRSKVIGNIVKLVQDKQYDGVNIDFELLKPAHKDNLTAFMRELYPQLKQLNKTVIISIFPKVDVHEDVSGAYDYPQLAKNADYLQIMTYDKHWATSKPGAIAPLDWYEKNIQYAIEQAGGPQKLIIGVSAYGYDWPPDAPGETITYVDAVVLAKQQGVKIEYDETAQAPHFAYKGHEVWFEDARSTAAKLAVVAKYNPAGIAIWRLGQEQPEAWNEIAAKFPKK
ncbi:MAG: glycosyl hydrolase family 18 protein [Sporomusaceae bacterium]|nr:glycosyl hydrolase family 18 protein [Sporomusaceae bacterium]